jgi:membrane associated rhomboid family serine protease
MPPVTKNLIIINVLFFLGTLVAARYGIDLGDVLGLHFFLAKDFHFYQFFTYMFMHANFWHIFWNMFAVWMFGRIMEAQWGSRKFLFFYIVCGIGAGLTQEVSQYVAYSVQGLANYDMINLSGSLMPIGDYLNLWNTVGASGAIYGILLAFGMTYPNEPIFLMFIPIPIKAKYFVIGYAAIELFSGFGGSADNVAHFAHLGGMLFGLFLILYWRHQERRRGYYTSYSTVGRGSFKDWLAGVGRKMKPHRKPKVNVHVNGEHCDDYNYNAERNAREKEIDRILEKVKRSGYSSLTDDEKHTLFDGSRR